MACCLLSQGDCKDKYTFNVFAAQYTQMQRKFHPRFGHCGLKYHNNHHDPTVVKICSESMLIAVEFVVLCMLIKTLFDDASLIQEMASPDPIVKDCVR